MAQKKVLTETGLSRLVTLINEKYAPSVSPTLTGTPTAPTPATNDESTKIATTEFVKNKLATDFTAFTKAEIYMMFDMQAPVENEEDEPVTPDN